MAEPRLDHVGLTVRDLAAAESWYCGAFGYHRELTLRVEALELAKGSVVVIAQVASPVVR